MNTYRLAIGQSPRQAVLRHQMQWMDEIHRVLVYFSIPARQLTERHLLMPWMELVVPYHIALHMNDQMLIQLVGLLDNMLILVTLHMNGRELGMFDTLSSYKLSTSAVCLLSYTHRPSSLFSIFFMGLGLETIQRFQKLQHPPLHSG